MNIKIDNETGNVYVGLRTMPSGAEGGVSHSLEKHGVLLCWDGHGTLVGVQFAPPSGYGEPVIIESEPELAANQWLCIC